MSANQQITKSYIEVDDQIGAHIVWNGANLLYKMTTHRGTRLEFVQRPNWGISCYMDGVIQSCEHDEELYHQALVDPVIYTRDDGDDYIVAIFGGGEGATAREVLKYKHVAAVDMFEWDHDVIHAFKDVFPSWADGAWDDERLNVIVRNAFSVVHTLNKSIYETVIIDMFEPSDKDVVEWIEFFRAVKRILRSNGTLSVYAGMYDHFGKGYEQRILRQVLEDSGFVNIRLHRVCIPSFLGESCFMYAEKPGQSLTEDNTV
jgi:spermidine synthase